MLRLHDAIYNIVVKLLKFGESKKFQFGSNNQNRKQWSHPSHEVYF